MKYEVKNSSGEVVAIFENDTDAKEYAAKNQGYTVVVKTIGEERQITLPSFLTES